MTLGQSLLTHWYFHIPNLVLAILVYLLIGRLVVSLIFGRDSRNRLVRLLTSATNPVLKGVGAITPRAVPLEIVIVFAAIWLQAGRMALFIAASATGVRLSMS